MKKQLFALLLAALLLLTACGGPAQTATAEPTQAPVEKPAETAAPAPTAAPTAAPTEEPAPEEYQLEREPGCNQLSIYWTKDKIDIDTSDMWIWFKGKDGRSYPMHSCAYGAKVVINVPEDVEEVGFIVRTGCSDVGSSSWGTATKDFDGDRFVKMEGGDLSIFLKSGEETIYYSEDGGMNLQQKMNIKFAGIVAENQIKYTIEPAARLTSLDQVQVKVNGQPVAVEKLSSLNNEVITGVITTKEKIDITAECVVSIEGYGEKVAVPTAIFDSPAFEAMYTYSGDDLGAYIHGDTTTFKVWAPTASQVVLNLFEAGNGGKAFATVDMTRVNQGVWTADYACGHGTYYTYTVTTAVGTQEAVDPYARAVGVNGDRGMVIDLASTDPEGFRDESFDLGLTSYRDAIIWEVHVRDFSNRIAASQYPGKYLAFTETGLTNAAGLPAGIDYLKELGVTHVHLQPVYDYATVDETTCTQFNWGYDPKNYNAPEGSYSTDPYHGEVRVNEFKQMVQALHENGFAVVMDVVYNHTYSLDSCLNRIVPYYYYRFTNTGDASNGSGCGNETASERKMFRKYMVDSVTYWQTEYHIDGFRFDLMGLHDVDTMQAIEKAVHKNNPQAILYGEGWTGGTTTMKPNTQATQANIRQVKASEGAIGGVAVFNDAIRDGLKGSVFDNKTKGWISTNATKTTANQVLFGITGGDHGAGASWKVDDALMINYMSCHDNRTLWDILANVEPKLTNDQKLAANRLGASLILMSKGTPFFLAGEEMLRTKGGDHNSYNSSDAVNNIDWDALTTDSDAYAMMLYYKDLIALRKANPWLYNSAVAGEVLEGSAIAASFTEDGKLVGYLVANPNEAPMTVDLPEGTFEALWGATGDFTSSLTVEAKTAVLLKVK